MQYEHDEHKRYSKSLIITIICIPVILLATGFIIDSTPSDDVQTRKANMKHFIGGGNAIMIPICYHCKHETSQYRAIQHHVPSTFIHG